MTRSPRMWQLGCLVVLVVGTSTVPDLRADPPALPAAEQARVNEAIERGARFLQAVQQPQGAWASPEGKYVAGHTALCGLTLLECGVDPNSPGVQRAVRAIRVLAPSLKTTYEISLSILFLDRYGSPKDRRLIQTLALRLIAGQTPTGGWGYQCPELGAADQRLLFTVLNRLRDRPHIPGDLLVRIGRPALPAEPARPGQPAAAPDRRLGQPIALVARPGLDRPAIPGLDSLARPALGPSPGEQPEPEPAPAEGAEGADGVLGKSLLSASEPAATAEPAVAAFLPRRGLCIRAGEPVPAPGEEQGDGEEPAQADPPRQAGPVVIPPRLRGLPVLQDPRHLVLQDLPDRGRQPFFATTDNSNTQMAMLALWAAQRHDVPMRRSLNLLAIRFCTSQNKNGTWSYRYVFGGDGSGKPTMTAVGLIGLAIGHGLAHEPGRNAPELADRRKDPLVLQGFAALSRAIGSPVEKIEGLKQPNLYFLWSIERVGVLYNLDHIGGKSWYRWGAQCLLANQVQAGCWTEGGYHGTNPILDTCFALLFLKRADLVNDLARQLPFQPGQLGQEIEQVVKKDLPPVPPRKPELTAVSATPSEKEAAPGPEPEEAPPALLPKDTLLDAGGAAAAAPPAEAGPAAETSSGGGGKWWVGVGLIVLALPLLGLAGYLVTRQPDAEEEERPRKKRKRD